MPLKQQSALEFIMIYSWAFLIISLFVVAVFLLSGTKPPSTYLGSSCNIQPLLPCSESLLTYNSVNPLQYYLVFSNQLGSVLYFPPNSINVTSSGVGSSGTSYSIGNCTPSFASQGTTVLCTARLSGSSKPKTGTQTSVVFAISYNICTSNTKSSCGAGIYKSTGFSVQVVAPSNINLYNLTFITNPSTGTVVLNGATYFNGTSIYLPSGNYPVFGLTQPPGSTGSFSWSVNAPSTLSSTNTRNAILSLNSNTMLTASYTSITTTTSTQTTTTSTTSSSTTSTSTSVATTTSTSTTSTSTSTSISTTSSTSSTSTTSAATTTVNCNYGDCHSCGFQPQCGWCASGGGCEVGTGFGPDQGSCSNWIWDPSQC